MHRLILALICECGKATEGFEVWLKPGGSSPVSCPECGAHFEVKSRLDQPERIVVDPFDPPEEPPVH